MSLIADSEIWSVMSTMYMSTKAGPTLQLIGGLVAPPALIDHIISFTLPLVLLI